MSFEAFFLWLCWCLMVSGYFLGWFVHSQSWRRLRRGVYRFLLARIRSMLRGVQGR